MLEKIWACLFALLCLAFTAALAESGARAGDVGTWMLVGKSQFWNKPPEALELKEDGSITLYDNGSEIQLKWIAGEDGGISKIESLTSGYAAKVREDFIIIARVWNGLETERIVYRYMFDASDARVSDPEYGDTGLAGVWEGENRTLTLAPNGSGQLRVFYFSDDIDYVDIWWHPLPDGSGIRLMRIQTAEFEDVPLENGALMLDEGFHTVALERTDEEVDAAKFQNYASLDAAPTPAPTSTPEPEIFSNGEFSYRALEDGVEIVSYLGNGQRLTVPEEIEGKSVVRIGGYAFSRVDMLINVTIPGCVKEIASYAFFECPLLSKVTIQSGTEAIGEYAFYDCGRLGLVSVPGTVNSIGKSAFLVDPKHDDAYIVVERGSYAERYAETEGVPYSVLPPDADDVPEELDLQPGNVARFAGTEWLVLLRKGGRAMLLRWEPLPGRAFHSGERGSRWRDSDLRAWLNGEYLNGFDEQERAIIENSLTITEPNRNSDFEISDPPTMDRAFLLDDYELEELMPDEASRKAYLEDGSTVNWWLRTDGAAMDHQMAVNEDGSAGERYDSTSAGVRPAIFVDLTRAEGLVEFAAENAEGMYERVSEKIRERLCGVWICQSGGDEGNRAATLTLNADGTGSCVCADMLAAPGEIYESYDFRWTFDEENVFIERDGEREELGILDDSLWMASMVQWLRKAPQYEALMRSARECDWTTLEALLGVWEVRDAQIGEESYVLKLTLKPDAEAVFSATVTRLENGGIAAQSKMEQGGYWRVTSNGVRVTSQDGSFDEEILFNGDGTIGVDGLVFPAVRAASLDDWQGEDGSYAYRENQDFTGSEFIGVWRTRRIADEYDDIQSELLLRLAKDGTGAFEDAYSGRTISIDWSPEESGIRFGLAPGEEQFLEIGLIPDAQDEMRMEEGVLSWISNSMAGYLSFEKVADDYVLAADGPTALPTLPPMPEPTYVPVWEFIGDDPEEPRQESVGDDSEESLREYLSGKADGAEFAGFFYDDYDGDGSCEAFALAGVSDDDGCTGELWFVGSSGARQLMEEASFLSLNASECGAFKIFTAEEWYGGSGSESHVWYVKGGEAKELAVDSLGDFTYDGGNEFSSYPDAFDMYSDGTGHTWKRYYYYFDLYREELLEYGGMYIPQEWLLAWPGAREILEDAQNRGWNIGEIYYRANGVINVNLYERDGGSIAQNDNLTLRIEDGSVVDTGESYTYGGSYDWANSPDIAEAPTDFPMPAEPVDVVPLDDPEDGESKADLEAQAPSGMDVFEFENLSSEFVMSSEMEPDGEYQNYVVHLRPGVNVGGSDGYFENWVTEEGVLCDAALDLDDDGQDEYLIYETRNQAAPDEMGLRTIGSLAVFESREGEWVEADRVEGLGSLMPMGNSSIRIVRGKSGTLLAEVNHGMQDGAVYHLEMNLLRYDGERLRRTLRAGVSDGMYSWFASEPVPDAEPVEIESAISASLWQGDSSELEALGLSVGQNLTLYEPEEDDPDWTHDPTGFEMLIDMIYEDGLDIYFAVSADGHVEDLMVVGGETFLEVEDGYNTLEAEPDDTCLVLCTTLDHKPGQGSEDMPDSDIPVEDYAGAYVTGDVNLRSGPGLDCDSVTTVPVGSQVEYLNEMSVDERGVVWYRVSYCGTEGWGSSKFVVVE